jgi:hypothetical protein
MDQTTPTDQELLCKTQIWIAISVYVLVAIAKKRLQIDASLYSFLQVVGVTAFEKSPILQVFQSTHPQTAPANIANQLSLFDF